MHFAFGLGKAGCYAFSCRMNDLWRKAVAYLKVQAPRENAVSLSESDSPVLVDLNNGLVVAYVVDDGQSFSYIQHYHLAEAGIEIQQLHEYGLSNLKQIAAEQLQVREYGPIYSVFLDGNFEASLILVPELWDKGLAHLVQGEFIAALPARDVLAFCDASSSEGIAELRKVVLRVAGGDHLLTTSLYRRMGSHWTQHVK